MSDRSPSLIPTEVAAISVMSDEASGIDDGTDMEGQRSVQHLPSFIQVALNCAAIA